MSTTEGPFALDPATIDAIARRVLELQRELPERTADILTLAEARDYVKRPSKPAFYAWCKRWAVEAKAHGRYSRAQLDLALDREAGLARTPASLRREQERRVA